MHNVELHNLNSSPNIIRMIKQRRTRENNIKIHLIEIRWSCMDWINLVQDRRKWQAFVKTVMKYWVSSNVGKYLKI
jgi:hypothetical protein